MASVIKTPSDGYNSFYRVTLSGSEYIIRIRANKRSGPDGRWYFKFYDSALFDETVTDNSPAGIFGEKKIVPNVNLIKMARDDRMPKGQLFCFEDSENPANSEGNVILGNFGTGNSYNLIYYTNDEITRLGG